MIDINKKYRTRDGREVRIYAMDGQDEWPIHGAVLHDFGWVSECWRNNGTALTDAPDEDDLIEARPRHKRTVWLNVHVNRSVIAHDLKEEADKLFCKDVAPRIACIKVELDFEEGEGL